MDLADFKKNYLNDKTLLEHSRLVAKLSIKLFLKLVKIFPDLGKYNNKTDIMLLEYGALLHDIGVILEKKLGRGHHKIGRDLILENKISNLDEEKNLIVANIVRYHRRALPDINEHKWYKNLNPEARQKTDIFAAIVRFADALDYNHFNIADDFDIGYDIKSNILTIVSGVNIMLNVGYIDALNKKKDFLEKILGTRVLIN